jgi:hypothetical protein
VQHHVEEEENELLPQLQQAVDTDRLVELGKAFSSRRAAELTGQGSRPSQGNGSARAAHARTGKGKTGQGKDGEDLQQKTKEELYAQAREAGIEGRSSMSKQELLRALSSR